LAGFYFTRLLAVFLLSFEPLSRGWLASIPLANTNISFFVLHRPILICGTPDEIASNPNFGDRGFTVVEPEGTGFRANDIWEYSVQRHTIWHHLALHGQDQLRQKMAWSLSQIVAVGLPGSGMVFYEPTEDRLAFYDFFVKHAFGNYREILLHLSSFLLMHLSLILSPPSHSALSRQAT
jgi:hypothetical protein